MQTVQETLRLRAEEERQRGLARSSAPLSNATAPDVPLSFVSNDTLGLSADPRWRARVAACFQQYSPSGRASRLAGGRTSLSDEAEQVFARYFGFAECLFFPSGYQANLACITALLPRGHIAFVDRRIHASMARALPLAEAEIRSLPHASVDGVRRRLAALSADARQPLVLTESLFSMDGDGPDMPQLSACCRQAGAFLIVDEAHALGAWGEGGRGFACGSPARAPLADLVVGTLGKALGLWGAFLLLPAGFTAFMEQFCSALIHSTTLPEAHAAACLALLEYLPALDAQRQQLHENCCYFRQQLQTRGIPAQGQAHIVMIPLHDAHKAQHAALALRKQGILVLPARYPTVPPGHAALRFSLSALHTQKDLDTVVTALAALFANG